MIKLQGGILIKRYIEGKKLNIIVLLIYSVMLIAVICFHEPWYDEAQSWLIARDASFREMLVKIPHYEGHPPLWWLILAVPAKLGMPYELSIKISKLLLLYLQNIYSFFTRLFRNGLSTCFHLHIFCFISMGCRQDHIA